jgi:hypothetical protein
LSAPRPGGFEGFVPISEGLLSHHPPVFDREEEGELVSIHGNLAHRSHPVDLGYRDHLVSGVDQLDGVDRVPGQSLLVLLVDQTYGLVAVVGPQEERFEYHVWVINLGQSIEVATVVRGESRSDQVQVLLRHRPQYRAKAGFRAVGAARFELATFGPRPNAAVVRG